MRTPERSGAPAPARGSVRLWVAWLALCVLPATEATAQGGALDVQTRWPALAPGDLLLVRSASASPHLDTAIGLDFDVLRRPLLVVDDVVGTTREVVATRLTATVLYALGLFGRGQASVAAPVAYQTGQGRAALTGRGADVLRASAMGDLRLDFSWAFLVPRSDAQPWGLAMASGLVVPTGDAAAFSGGTGPVGRVAVMGERRQGLLRLMTEVGLRARGSVTIGDVRVGSQLVASAAAALELLDRHLSVALEGRTIVGLVPDSRPTGLLFVEVGGRFGADRVLQVVAGLGLGLGDSPTSPALEGTLQLRYVPRESGRP